MYERSQSLRQQAKILRNQIQQIEAEIRKLPAIKHLCKSWGVSDTVAYRAAQRLIYKDIR